MRNLLRIKLNTFHSCKHFTKSTSHHSHLPLLSKFTHYQSDYLLHHDKEVLLSPSFAYMMLLKLKSECNVFWLKIPFSDWHCDDGDVRWRLSHLSADLDDTSGASLPPRSPLVLHSQTLLSLLLHLLHRVCIWHTRRRKENAAEVWACRGSCCSYGEHITNKLQWGCSWETIIQM